MKIKGKHFQRYKQIANLLWKYGSSDLVDQMGIDDALDEADLKAAASRGDPLPEQLADDLEAMGPTYVKLGQLLASRPDLLPDAYTSALARLQDKVKPFPYEQVEEIVAAELGARISKAFSRFDPAPIAAASLGQVHAAALRDGRQVVVKVQRPDIAKQIAEDFEVLGQIAEFLEAHTEKGKKYQLLDVLEEFRITIKNELDYEREAQNLISIGKTLEEFELIQVPQPVPDYTTRRVLTMDYVRGRKITNLSPLTRLDLDGRRLAEELFKAYLRQVLVVGLFHADPHPGNVFLTDDGRIALLDLGMLGHTTPVMRQNLLKILIAISEGKSEDAAKVVIEISGPTEEFDAAAFNKRIAQILVDSQGREIGQINVGSTLLAVTRAATKLGLSVPSELSLLSKTLLQLDEVGKILDPEFDPNAAIRRNVTELMSERVNRDVTSGSAMKTLLDMKDFITGLPERLNKVMDVVGKGEMEVNVRATDANLFMEGLQKIANRITSGIVISALIIGASLLMRVESDLRIFGYPGLATPCFLGAATGGVWLLASIFLQDSRGSKKPRVRKSI
jgi:ubiquinone biosynthesis protein